MKSICRILVTALLLGLCLSCEVKNRIYRDGFYIEHLTSKFHKKAKHFSNSTIRFGNDFEKPEPQVKNEVCFLVPLAFDSDKILPYLSLKFKKHEPDSCGDLIIFRDGKKMPAKIFEVGEEDISYKTCDQMQGPLRRVKKSKVSKINFMDGRTSSFVPATSIQLPDKTFQNKVDESDRGTKKVKKTPLLIIIVMSVLALATLILALSGIYVMLIPFFILLCAALIVY